MVEELIMNPMQFRVRCLLDATIYLPPQVRVERLERLLNSQALISLRVTHPTFGQCLTILELLWVPLDGFARSVVEVGRCMGVGRSVPSSATACAHNRRHPGEDDEDQDRSERRGAVISQDPLMRGSQCPSYRETDQ